MKTFKKRLNNLISSNTRLWRRNPAGLPAVAEASLRLFDRLKSRNPTLNLAFSGEVRGNKLKVTARIGGVERKLELWTAHNRQYFHIEPRQWLEEKLQKNLDAWVAEHLDIQQKLDEWKGKVKASPAKCAVHKVTNWGAGKRTYVLIQHPMFSLRIKVAGLAEDPEVSVTGFPPGSQSRLAARAWVLSLWERAYESVEKKSGGIPDQPMMTLAYDSLFGSYPADGRETLVATSEWVEMPI